MSRIFLSHSSVDSRAAVALKKWLTEQRPELANEIFLDIDPESGLQVGARWKGQLFESNSRCEAVICLVSTAWEGSHECKTEYRTSEGLGKQILVARLEDTDSDITSEWQRCDLFAAGAVTEIGVPGGPAVRFNTAALYALRKAIEGTGVGPQNFVWPPKSDPSRVPYRGWEPFDDIDAGVFFGRDAAIVRGLDELRAMRLSGLKSLFVVLGPSGSGKSSFLRAGLIPRLQREDRRFVVLGIMRPGRNALTGEQGLAVSIYAGRQRLGLDTVPLGDIRQACRSDPGRVVELLTEIRSAAAARLVDAGQDGAAPTLVLPLDQAEELFSADAGVAAEQFLTLIADVLGRINTEEAGLVVAATIRTDRYEVMQDHPALVNITKVLFDELRSMLATLFERVITGPAERTGEGGRRMGIAPDLVTRLIADAEEGADTLPLLALTLARLYADYASTGELTVAHYEALGGMHQVVQTAIDEVLATDPGVRAGQLELLRSAFIPWLATVSPDSDQPTRRVARDGDLPESSRPLIDALVEKRLLVRDERDGQTVVEVALESLLRQWEELAGWLREERQHLKTADDIERSATAWAVRDRDPAWLLTGTRLTDAETLATTAGFADRLAGARDYLAACRQVEDQRLAAEEEQRQAEVRFAQERQRTAEAHAATLRRRGRILQAVLVGTALIAVVAVVMFTQAKIAHRQAQQRFLQSTALRLNAEAADLLAGTTAGGDARAFQEILAARTLVSPADEGALLHAAAIRNTTATITDTGTPVRALAYSPDGHTLATGGDDHRIQIFNAHTGQPVRTLTGHSDTVNTVAFSPDGHTLASGSDDHTVRIFNTDTGQLLRTLTGNTRTVTAVAFSPDGHTLASAGHDGTVRLWNPDTGESLGTTPPSADEVDCVTFSPDGHRLAAGGDDDTAHMWDLETGQQLHTFVGHTKSVTSVAFSPDGHRLATGSHDQNVRLWNADTGEQLGKPLNAQDIGVTSVAFSPDGHLLASSAGDGTVVLWNPDNGEQVGAKLVGHTTVVWQVAFSPDGHHLASGGGDHILRQWDLTKLLTGQVGMVDGVAFSPDGHRLASGDMGGMIWLWDADTGRPVGPPLMGHSDAVESVAFSPDGHRLVSGGQDKSVRLWNIDTRQQIGPPLNGHDAWVYSVAFSPDGHKVASGDNGGTVLLWDAGTGQLISPLMSRPGDTAADVAFRPDGRIVAIADTDGTIRMRDVYTGKPTIAPITMPGTATYGVAFSPDGNLLASASSDGVVRLFRSDTGKLLTDLAGHNGIATSVAFSPDGHRLVSGGRDGSVRLWNVDTKHALAAPFTGHLGWVNQVAFSPDNRLIASAGFDGTIRLWPAVASPADLCAKLTTNMSKKQWHDWVSADLPYETQCRDLPIAPG
jgi:WD40 repeat protein